MFIMLMIFIYYVIVNVLIGFLTKHRKTQNVGYILKKPHKGKIRLTMMPLVPVAVADIFGLFLTHFADIFWQTLVTHKPCSAWTCTKQIPDFLISSWQMYISLFHRHPDGALIDWTLLISSLQSGTFCLHISPQEPNSSHWAHFWLSQADISAKH